MTTIDFDREDRTLRARAKIQALAYLFSQCICDSSMERDAAAGLGWLLDDIDALLADPAKVATKGGA